MLKVANAATLIPYDLVLVREHIASLKKLLLQRSAPSSQIIAAAQLDVLAERIERLSNEFYSPAGISSNSAALLDADLKSFAAINKALLQGSSSIGTAIAASGAEFCPSDSSAGFRRKNFSRATASGFYALARKSRAAATKI